MNKHPEYRFEVKGYSSAEVQNNYGRLYVGEEVYISKSLEVLDSKKRLLGNLTQKSIKENNLDLLLTYPSYFSVTVSYYTRSKSDFRVLNIIVKIKDKYAYFFFKNHPETEGVLFDFYNIFERESTVYTNYGPAKFISAYKDSESKYFIVDIPLIGTKSIYDIYSVEK